MAAPAFRNGRFTTIRACSLGRDADTVRCLEKQYKQVELEANDEYTSDWKEVICDLTVTLTSFASMRYILYFSISGKKTIPYLFMAVQWNAL